MNKIFLTGFLLTLSLFLISETMTIETTSETFEFDLSEIENIEFSGIVDVEIVEVINAINFKLNQNHPNPFNPETKISFILEESGDVNLSIYNGKGQKVYTVFNGEMNSGNYSKVWAGRDDNNAKVASGVYFYKLTYNGQIQTKKMIMLK